MQTPHREATNREPSWCEAPVLSTASQWHPRSRWLIKHQAPSPLPPSCWAASRFPGALRQLRSRGGSWHFQTPHPRWRQTPAAERRFPGDRGATGRKAPGRCSGPRCGSSRWPRPASADGSPEWTEVKTHTAGVGTMLSKHNLNHLCYCWTLQTISNWTPANSKHQERCILMLTELKINVVGKVKKQEICPAAVSRSKSGCV